MEQNSVLLQSTEDIVKVLEVLGIYYKGPRWIQYLARKFNVLKFDKSAGYIFVDTNGRYVGGYNFVKHIYKQKMGKDLGWEQYENAVKESELL